MDLLTTLTNLPISVQVTILGTAHCLLGITATAISQRSATRCAYSKGYSFSRWLAIGLIGGTPALIGAILLKTK